MRSPDTATFLKLILPAAGGIAAASLCPVPVWLGIVCCMVSAVCAWGSRRTPVSGVYVWLGAFFFFMAAATVRMPRSELPAGERITVAVQIREAPYKRGRWQNTTADVGYIREGDGRWRKVRERIQLSIDTSYRGIVPGSQIAFRGWFNPIDTLGTSYGQLMQRRGLHGRMYLVPGNLVARAPHVSRTPAWLASRMQAAALERIARLELSPDAEAIVAAMTAGDKRAVDRVTRADYSRSGAAHLLAVSGLHVGIVFMLINILLYLLPVFSRGHVARNALAIVAIWLYAMTAGLSPSVVRSALMFSFAQLALATTSRRSALNIMLGSAVIMLVVNPNYAVDPSFLLSYAAVLSITLFFGPLFALLRSRWKIVNALTSVLIVGLTATIGTAPLISYWFGNIPVAGLLINPMVIFTANVIVLAGVFWVVFPFGFLQPVIAWLLDAAVGVQNAAVSWAAARSWGSIEVFIPLWLVLLAYVAYIAFAVWLYSREEKTPTLFGKHEREAAE